MAEVSHSRAITTPHSNPFGSLDLNQDGVVDKTEFGKALSSSGIPVTKTTAESMFNKADLNNDGVLTQAELSQSNELCALTRAIKSNDVRAAMNAIYDKDTVVDEKDPAQFDRTLLHKAAAMGSTVSLAFLINRKADMLVRDQKGYTPLELAILHGHTDGSHVLARKIISELGRKGLDSLVINDPAVRAGPKTVICTIL